MKVHNHPSPFQILLDVIGESLLEGEALQSVPDLIVGDNDLSELYKDILDRFVTRSHSVSIALQDQIQMVDENLEQNRANIRALRQQFDQENQ